MKALLSAVFWLYLALSLAAFWIVVAPVWVLITPFDRRRRFSHWYAITWATHYIALSPFWDVHVEGTHKIENDGTYVLVANHQSAADIMVLYCLRKHFKWVSKRSNFFVPFLGWMMWMADYVPLRRGDRRSRADMFRRCHAHLRRGSSIMMFPEGTRSRDGEIKDFKRGAFTLAAEAGVPVVPVVIDGTFSALPRGGWVFRQDGQLHMTVDVLDPVDPAEVEGDPARLQRLVRSRMVEHLAARRSNREFAASHPVP